MPANQHNYEDYKSAIWLKEDESTTNNMALLNQCNILLACQ